MKAQYEEKPFVAVQGTAVKYAIPDEILISFSVYEKASDLKSARKMGSEKVRNVVNYLERAGVDKKHIQTNYQNIGTRMKHHNSNEVDFYEFRQQLNVCITEMKKYDQIIDGLINEGIYNVGTPTFRTTELESIKKEVYKEALKAAKEKAQMMSSELNQNIGKALYISDINNASPRFSNAYIKSAAMESNSGGPSIAAGELQISQTVTVYFELID